MTKYYYTEKAVGTCRVTLYVVSILKFQFYSKEILFHINELNRKRVIGLRVIGVNSVYLLNTKVNIV